MAHIKRKSLRLKNYDYSRNGAYFITICTRSNQPLLWSDTHNPSLSNIGKIVHHALCQIPVVFDGIVLLENYVIMPNHLHLILTLSRYGHLVTNVSIPQIINGFKGAVTKKLGYTLWQKSFHDHIIRGQDDYEKIWHYIDDNPRRWKEDRYFVP